MPEIKESDKIEILVGLLKKSFPGPCALMPILAPPPSGARGGRPPPPPRPPPPLGTPLKQRAQRLDMQLTAEA
jgi:hypothetical protein